MRLILFYSLIFCTVALCHPAITLYNPTTRQFSLKLAVKFASQRMPGFDV